MLENLGCGDYHQLKEFYDRRFWDLRDGKWWDSVSYTAFKEYQFIIKQLGLAEDPNKKLLDVGCGAGHFLDFVKNLVEPYGIDLSSVAVQMAKELLRERAHIHCGSAESLPYRDDYFDFVTCLGSLEHFLNMQAALKEMRRVAKTEGKILIYVPNLFSYHHIIDVLKTGGKGVTQEQEVQRFATLEQWRRTIEKSGLRVTKVAGYNLRTRTHWRLVLNPKRFFAVYILPYIVPTRLAYCIAFLCAKG